MKAQILEMLDKAGIDRSKVMFFDGTMADGTRPKTSTAKVSKPPRMSKAARATRPSEATMDNMVSSLPRILASLSDRQLPSWRKKVQTLFNMLKHEFNMVKEGQPIIEEKLEAFDAPDKLPAFSILIDEIEVLQSQSKVLHRSPLNDKWSSWSRSEKEARILDAFRFGVDLRKKQHELNDLFRALTKKLSD